MLKEKSRKVLLWSSLAVSLLAVFVAVVTTFSWFQIDNAPIKSSTVTGSSDIEIQDVTGYKVEHTANNTYDSSSIVSKKSTGTEIDIEDIRDNQDLEGADTNYDIPDLGDGYYLLKKNSEDAFKYTRTYSGSAVTARNYIKFTKVDSTNNLYVTDTFTANQVIRLQKYTNENNVTINKQLRVQSVGPAQTAELASEDIKILSAGTYTIWIQTVNMTNSGTPKKYFVSSVVLEKTDSSKSLLPKGAHNIVPNRATSNTKSNLTQSGYDNYTLKVNISSGNTNAYWQVWNGSSNIEVWSNGGNFENTNVGSIFPNSDTTIYVKRCNPSNHGQTYNEWAISGVNKNKNNFIEITKWQDQSSPYTVQTKSTLKVYYVLDGTCDSSPRNTYTCWNKDTLVSSGLTATPSLDCYTFGGWYTTSACSTSATNVSDSYIAANASIYAKFTSNNPSTSKRFYLYDPNDYFLSGGSVVPCAYFYGNNYATTAFPGIPMTKVSGHTHLWYVDSYSDYSHVIFSNGTNSYQTSNIALNASYNAYHFVNGSSPGWYNVTFTDSGSTYYLYDPNGYLGTGTPKAYYWGHDADKYTTSVPATPGKNMTSQATYDGITPDVSRLYSVNIFSECTGILFNDGNVSSKKTVDISLTGHVGDVFVITGGSGTSITGGWTKGVDCFYLEVNSSVGWTHVRLNDSGGNQILANLDAFKIPSSTYFYKVYFKKNYSVQFCNADNTSGASNWSAAFNLNTRTSNYIYIESSTNGSGNRNVTAKGSTSSSAGTATIYVSTNGGSSFTGTAMSDGDLTYNDFIYELGLEIPVNSIVYIQKSPSTYYKYNELITADKNIGYLADDGTNNHNIKTVGYTDTARFNFYITHSGELSMRMVPLLGNGYYVMKYAENNNQTQGFIGAKKMSSTSKSSATYHGYYANADDVIFIRSYIDAVDTLCGTSSVTIADGVSATNLGSGKIKFTASTYYSIEVLGESVKISAVTHDNFFALGPLDTTGVSSQAGINSQYTSLVLDVSFKLQATNSFDLNLSLEATIPSGLRNYVGVQFYYGTAADPYTYMRTYTSSHALKTYANLAQLTTFTITKGTSSETVLHAYIIMDYVYSASLTNLPTVVTDQLSFHLKTAYTKA